MNYSAFRDYLKWYIAAYNKQQAAIPFFGHTKMLHVLVSMGSTALMAAVVLPRYGGLNYVHGLMKY